MFHVFTNHPDLTPLLCHFVCQVVFALLNIPPDKHNGNPKIWDPNIHLNDSEQYEIYLLSRSNRNFCAPPPSNTLSPISCAVTSAATRCRTIAIFLGKLRPNINRCFLTICLPGCLLLCPLPRDWVITNCILA